MKLVTFLQFICVFVTLAIRQSFLSLPAGINASFAVPLNKPITNDANSAIGAVIAAAESSNNITDCIAFLESNIMRAIP